MHIVHFAYSDAGDLNNHRMLGPFFKHPHASRTRQCHCRPRPETAIHAFLV